MKELLYLKDDQLKELIEKLFIGYRETFSDSKKILNKYSIGLAHQKVIHLISMYEGISISELLNKLKITKQSLSRVLNQLVNEEFIFNASSYTLSRFNFGLIYFTILYIDEMHFNNYFVIDFNVMLFYFNMKIKQAIV